MVIEEELSESIKKLAISFVDKFSFELANQKNREVRIVLESSFGSDLYELHSSWKVGHFPEETEFEKILGNFHKIDPKPKTSEKYFRMEINQIESEAGHGSWAGYCGEFTSVIFDQNFEIIDTKSERFS
jgi:hypothetical protein